MTISDLTRLRERIGSNYLQILQERTNWSRTAIYNTMNGVRSNQEIIDAAFEILEERRLKEQDQLALLNQ